MFMSRHIGSRLVALGFSALTLSACGGSGSSTAPPPIPQPPALVLPIGNNGGGTGTPGDILTAYTNVGRFEARAHAGLEIVGNSGFTPFADRIVANPTLAVQRTTTGFDLELATNNIVRYDTRPGSRHIRETNTYANCNDDCIGLGMGNTTVTTSFQRSATTTLSYATYGDWANRAFVGYVGFGVFALGIPTDAAQVPTTGTATYNGNSSGYAYTQNPYGAYSFVADVSLNANFAARTIGGAVTNIRATNIETVTTPTNTVSPVGNITLAGGAISGNSFSGTTTGSATPAGGLINTTGAAGQFGGVFYGPNAQEAAGSFTLKNSSTNLIGSFGTKR